MDLICAKRPPKSQYDLAVMLLRELPEFEHAPQLGRSLGRFGRQLESRPAPCVCWRDRAQSGAARWSVLREHVAARSALIVDPLLDNVDVNLADKLSIDRVARRRGGNDRVLPGLELS